MDKEIKDYIDKTVKEEVKNYFEHQEEARREVTSKSMKFKSEIRKLILANCDDAKTGYGTIYKKYNEETGDNTYLSAKEKGLSTIEYIAQYGDIKLLYSIALCEFGEESEKKLPSEKDLEKDIDERDTETIF